MFTILLREGITGGFAPPVVKQVVQINGDKSGASISHHSLNPSSRDKYTTQVGSLSSDQVETLVTNVKNQLQQLPMEEPLGSEDIYGLDTSIAFMSDDFQWQNGGPEGCGRDPSSKKATEEEKQKFQEIVNSIIGLGKQYALQAQ